MKRSGTITGNIYRLWALGMSGGLRQAIITSAVVCAQVLGAYMMFNFVGRKFADRVAVPLSCQFNHEHVQDVAGSLTHGFEVTLGVGGDYKDMAQEVQMKILGVLFLFILFFSSDQSLLKQDLETSAMRPIFGSLLDTTQAKFWMWVDSFVNNATVVMILSSSLGLFFSSDHVQELCLDAFGLIFLMRLDELDGDLNWDLDASDFDKAVEDFRGSSDLDKAKEEVRGAEKANKNSEVDDYEDDDSKEWERIKNETCRDRLTDKDVALYQKYLDNKWEKVRKGSRFDRLCHGDVLFSFARLFCFVSLIVTIPCFASLKFVEESKAGDFQCDYLSTKEAEQWFFGNSFKTQVLANYRTWLPWTCLIALGWVVALLGEFFLAPQFAVLSQNFCVPVDPDLFKLFNRDVEGFFWLVLLRRTDVRLEHARGMTDVFMHSGKQGWPHTAVEKFFAERTERKVEQRSPDHVEKLEYDSALEGGIFSKPQNFDPVLMSTILGKTYGEGESEDESEDESLLATLPES